jgi:hypothetical protein
VLQKFGEERGIEILMDMIAEARPMVPSRCQVLRVSPSSSARQSYRDGSTRICASCVQNSWSSPAHQVTARPNSPQPSGATCLLSQMAGRDHSIRG